MKKLFSFFVVVFFSISLTAQDSSKVFKHEIGFNTVSLIKQLFSNNPSSTLSQLPYDIFYNFYFNQRSGLRFGVGVLSTKNTSSIEGQDNPRTTNSLGLDGRAGYTYNFVRQKRLTLNAFADLLYHNNSAKTVNTQTTQTFGNPVNQITTTTSDNTTGFGYDIGVGVKYNIYNHLALYIEVPFAVMLNSTISQVKIDETISGTTNTKNTSNDASARIFLPTTVYLVLRF